MQLLFATFFRFTLSFWWHFYCVMPIFLSLELCSLHAHIRMVRGLIALNSNQIEFITLNRIEFVDLNRHIATIWTIYFWQYFFIGTDAKRVRRIVGGKIERKMCQIQTLRKSALRKCMWVQFVNIFVGCLYAKERKHSFMRYSSFQMFYYSNEKKNFNRWRWVVLFIWCIWMTFNDCLETFFCAF